MAAAGDKARFYLEQSIPELQEDLRKQIFTRDEITSITKKRSDFEHTINARGSQPSDYARYVEYEMNLNSLRLKRIKRLGVRAPNHTGQRRIFFILGRGTQKFQGDLGLWMQYMSFARQQKAYRKLEQILTSVLRLHPTKPQLWIYAARYALEVQADMEGAVTYMKRAVRFCQKSKEIYVEYAKLVMIDVARFEGRRRILGLDQDKVEKEEMEVDDKDADEIALPSITAEDVDPDMPKGDPVDEEAPKKFVEQRVRVTMAIFQTAMKELNNDSTTAESFFDMFAQFANISCTKKLLQHVLETMTAASPTSVQTLSCNFRLPLAGVTASSTEFPSALGQCLERIKKAMQQAPTSTEPLVKNAILCLAPFARAEDLDPAVEKVLKTSLRQYVKKLGSGDKLAGLVEGLQKEKRKDDAAVLLEIGNKAFGSEERLLALQTSAEAP